MSDPLDTKIVSRLAAILKVNDLAELEYETETCRISLIRSHAPVSAAAPMPFAPAAAPVPAPAAAPAAPAAAPAADSAADLSTPNYVKIGDSVTQGDTVCLIEAMKTFNPVKAQVSGKVTKILVESGDPVEYGEPLIVIE